MSYRIEKDEAPGPAARRIAGEEVAAALEEIRDDDMDVENRVHELRKHCKKIRAVVRLVRPGFSEYKQANRLFRDIARRLSAHRDARVMAELVDRLSEPGDETTADGHPAERWYWLRCVLAEQHAERVLAETEEALAAAAFEIERWDVDGITMDDVVGGMHKTLGRAYAAYRQIGSAPDRPPVRTYHEWRKRSKYHRLHMQLLDEFLPEPDAKREKIFDRIESRCGDAHDCSVLLEDIASEPPYLSQQVDVAQLKVALEQRRRKLRRKALHAADEVFGEPEDAFAGRLAQTLAG